MRKNFQTSRYLGLELSGAKSNKTTLASIEYFPKEKKIFLLDIHEGIGPENPDSPFDTGDPVLMEIIRESAEKHTKLASSSASTLPPLAPCSAKTSLSAVKWMQDITKKAVKKSRTSEAKENLSFPKVKAFVPYTQRPVELWVRYSIFPEINYRLHFEIDETLGANKAPLSMRMSFLAQHLKGIDIIETWPKLSLALLARDLELPLKTVENYRNVENGIDCREEIIDKFIKKCGLFIYERDIHKLARNLASFDAFLSAYTAYLHDLGECEEPPKGFPVDYGWVYYPKLI